MYLTQGLQRSLQQSPDRIATVFRGRRQRFSVLGRRVARLAGALRAQGLGAGERVAILARNSDRWLEAMMAIWWAGGVLHATNPGWTVPALIAALDDADTAVLILGDHQLHLAEGILAGVRRAPLLLHMGELPTPAGMLSCEALIEASEPAEDAGRGGADLASIVYTQGSAAAAPKAVMQTHLNLWSFGAHRLAEAQQVQRNGRVLHALPLCHPPKLARAAMQFMAGDAHVIVPAFDPADVLAAIEREAVTEILFTAREFDAVMAHPDAARRRLDSLRCVIFGRGPLELATLERIQARLPRAELHMAYGLTEACPAVSHNLLRLRDADGCPTERWQSVGRGGFGMSVKVIDAEGHEAPRGTEGQVLVRGPSLTPGYWNQPELTARVLRDGWMHTDDRARMDDEGFLYLVDRIKAAAAAAPARRPVKPAPGAGPARPG